MNNEKRNQEKEPHMNTLDPILCSDWEDTICTNCKLCGTKCPYKNRMNKVCDIVVSGQCDKFVG